MGFDEICYFCKISYTCCQKVSDNNRETNVGDSVGE